MKKIPVFLRVLLFVFAFLLLNHWTSRIYVNFTRQPYEYEGTRRGFEAVMDETSFLVLGDSHPLNSVFTPDIPGGYNFASGGESYVLTYYKMNHYLKKGRLDLDVVVMPISLHTFAGYRIQQIGKQDPAFWSQYVDFVQLAKETGQMEYFLSARVEAEFAYLGGLDEIFEVLLHSNDWRSEQLRQGNFQMPGNFQERSEEEQMDTAVKRAAFHFDNVEYIDPLVVTYFKRLLDLLEEEDVQMVFVSYPSTKEYQQASGSYISVDDHISKMESLLEGRENVLILDYHDLFLDRDDYFLNADHLNIDGAKVFTRIFLEDLEMNGVAWDVDSQP